MSAVLASGLTHAGRTLGTFTVRGAAEREVVGLDLSANDEALLKMVILKATARLDGGHTLWQAPIKWAYDPRLTRVGEHYLGLPLPRSDVLILELKDDAGVMEDDAGVFSTEVSASVGSASASLPIQVRLRRPHLPIAQPLAPTVQASAQAPMPAAAPQLTPCGCTSGSSLLPLGVALAAVLRRRYRRVRES